MSEGFGAELGEVRAVHDSSMRLVDLLTETIGKLSRSLEKVVKALDLCAHPDCKHPQCEAQLEALRGLLVVAGLEKKLREIGL